MTVEALDIEALVFAALEVEALVFAALEVGALVFAALEVEALVFAALVDAALVVVAMEVDPSCVLVDAGNLRGLPAFPYTISYNSVIKLA